jgi:RNA polymerase sigma-70 factor (ECF subfamily)
LSLDEFIPARDGTEGGKLQIADWSKLPDGQVLATEMNQVLHAAIRELPDGYRSVLLLRDVEELSTQDTAQILDLSADVVKTRLHRARLAVRKKVDEYLRAEAN